MSDAIQSSQKCRTISPSHLVLGVLRPEADSCAEAYNSAGDFYAGDKVWGQADSYNDIGRIFKVCANLANLKHQSVTSCGGQRRCSTISNSALAAEGVLTLACGMRGLSLLARSGKRGERSGSRSPFLSLESLWSECQGIRGAG